MSLPVMARNQLLDDVDFPDAGTIDLINDDMVRMEQLPLHSASIPFFRELMQEITADHVFDRHGGHHVFVPGIDRHVDR